MQLWDSKFIDHIAQQLQNNKSIHEPIHTKGQQHQHEPKVHPQQSFHYRFSIHLHNLQWIAVSIGAHSHRHKQTHWAQCNQSALDFGVVLQCVSSKWSQPATSSVSSQIKQEDTENRTKHTISSWISTARSAARRNTVYHRKQKQKQVLVIDGRERATNWMRIEM